MSELDPTKRTFGVTDPEGKWLLCCDCPSDGPETCDECACLYSDGTKTALVSSITGDMDLKFPWDSYGVGGWNCGAYPEPGMPGKTYQDATVPASELRDAINYVIGQNSLRAEVISGDECIGAVWTVPWGEKDITDPTYNGVNSGLNTTGIWGIAMCQDLSTSNNYTSGPPPVGSTCWAQANGFLSSDYRSLLDDHPDSFLPSSIVEIPVCASQQNTGAGPIGVAQFMGGIGIGSVQIVCDGGNPTIGTKIMMEVRFTSYRCGAGVGVLGGANATAYLTPGHIESLPNYEQYLTRFASSDYPVDRIGIHNADSSWPNPWVSSNCDSVPDLTVVSSRGPAGDVTITRLPTAAAITM